MSTPDLLNPADAPAALERPSDSDFGAWAGEFPWRIELSRLERVVYEKKWQWFSAFSTDVALGAAVVQTGYAGSAFVWVFDRKRRVMLADENRTLLPGMTHVGDDAIGRRIAESRSQVRMEREGSLWSMAGTLGEIRFDLTLDEGCYPALSAVCRTRSGRFNVTRKSVGATVKGSIRVGTHHFDLRQGRGMLDHTHGLMDRKTSWKWAIGSGPEGAKVRGFNLINTFNEGRESAVWTDEGVQPLGVVDIRRSDSVWKATNRHVDLELIVEGTRCEDLNLGVVASNYVQPLGVWRGRILDHTIDDYWGVAEDHHALW